MCEWDNANRQLRRHAIIEHHDRCLFNAQSYEANLRIVQREGQRPQLRELTTDQLLYVFADIEGNYNGCVLSADGHTAALLRGDEKLELVFLDLRTRSVRSKLTTEQPIGHHLFLSDDGKQLAASCTDQTVMIIDTLKGKIVRRLGQVLAAPEENSPPAKLTRGAFSADGELLAVGTYSPKEPVGVQLGAFNDHPQVTAGIRVWNVANGRELRQFENCLATAPIGAIPLMLRFSSDGKSLAVALHYNPCHPGDPEEALAPVLEVASGRFRRRFKGHTDQVVSIAFSPDGKRLATGSQDSTILVWDMNRPIDADPAVTKPTAERMNGLWSKLAGQDAAAAYDAILELAAIPNQSVPFLAGRLKPVEVPSNVQLAKWIADLDDDSFKVREMTSAKLAALHEAARSALQRALNNKASVEAHRRLKELVDQLDAMKYPPDLLRQLRCVEVLERIASKESRRLLEDLATGAPEAILTIEAKASLNRLKAAR